MRSNSMDQLRRIHGEIQKLILQAAYKTTAKRDEAI